MLPFLLATLGAAPAASVTSSQGSVPKDPAAIAAAPLAQFEGLEFRPVLGDWAEYRVRRPGESDSTVRVSVVGRESEPVEAWWLEFSVSRADRPIILKLLTVGHPGKKGALRRTILQLTPALAMELPVAPEEPQTQSIPEPVRPRRGPTRRVPTAAGTFEAFELKGPSGKALASDQVPIFGLIRGESSLGSSELVAKGSGATSQVRAAVQRIASPLFPSAWSTGKRQGAQSPAQPDGGAAAAPTPKTP